MARTFIKNQVPIAPFNLRTEGPLSEKYLKRKLGKPFRLALGKMSDSRATVDKDPCPDCGSLVEWSTTSKKNKKGALERYIYARCRGPQRHRWGFSGQSETAPTPTVRHKAIPTPRPSVGAEMTEEWAQRRIKDLEDQLDKYRSILTLSHQLATVPKPVASPQLPVPPNGDPTPPHHRF